MFARLFSVDLIVSPVFRVALVCVFWLWLVGGFLHFKCVAVVVHAHIGQHGAQMFLSSLQFRCFEQCRHETVPLWLLSRGISR